MTINLVYCPNADKLYVFKDGHSYEHKVSTSSDFGLINSADDTDDRQFILYALMHHFAQQNPQQKIKLAVLDDNPDRLNWYYDQHSHKMPANVTLEQQVVSGNGPRQVTETKGTGTIDSQYAATIGQKMAEPHQQQYFDVEDEYAFYPVEQRPLKDEDEGYESPEDDEHEPPQHLDEETDSKQSNFQLNEETEIKFNKAMKVIKRKENELWSAGISLLISGSPKAGLAINAAGYAGGLHEAMQAAYDKLKQNGDKDEFKRAAEEAISIAKNSPLKDHRGYKEILAYAGLGLLAVLSVATVGIAYLAAGTVNHCINGQFFLPTKVNTDSVNKVEDLQDIAEEIFAGEITHN